MNKIYRRLWSTARQCSVVASELTTAKGKASRTVGLAAATALLAAMPVVSAAETEDEAEEERQLQLHELRSIAEPIALARLLSSGTAVASAPLGTYRQLAVVTDNYYFDASVAGDEQLILGSRAGINGSKSVVYGNVAYASGTRSTALGYSSKAYTSYATAVGATAVADGVGTVALGNSANAYEKNSIAIGSGSMAFGENGDSRIAIGGNSRAGTNGWTGAIALGGESKAEFDAIALGHGARASQEGALAVGRGATASGIGALALGKDAVASENYTLSVGSASRKRRIVNVDDARLSTTSTDAVTGKQLHSTNQSVATATSTANAAKAAAEQALIKSGIVTQAGVGGMIRVGGENTGTVLDVRNKGNGTRRLTGLSDGALGSASIEAVTGRQLHATNQLVDTQGQALLAHGQTLTAHGQQLSLHDRRIGDNRTDLDKLRADFEGFDPDLEGVVRFAADGSVDMGGGKVRGIAAGDISSAASTEAVNGGQLFETNRRLDEVVGKSRFIQIGAATTLDDAEAGFYGLALGNGAQAALNEEGGTAIGSYTSAFGMNSVAVGRGAYVDESALDGFAMGAGSRVEVGRGVAVGGNAVVGSLAVGSLALGAYSVASEANTVSVGNSSTKRRIVNVDVGYEGNDATTASQLRSAISLLGGRAELDAAGNVVAPDYQVQGSQHGNVGSALAALDSAVFAADSRVNELDGWLKSAFQVRSSVRGAMNVIALAGAEGLKLTNLAEGTVANDSRDAVNGGQLFEANQRINENRGYLDKLKADTQHLLEASSKFAVNAEYIDYNGVRLTGVGLAEIGANSSDVVVGSQLYETNQRVSAFEAGSRFVAIGTGGAQVDARSGLVGVAIGDSAQASIASEGGVAIGAYAVAGGKNSVSLGRASYVAAHAEDGFALGVRSRVEADNSIALGAASLVQSGASHAIALGNDSIASESQTVSFGSEGLQRRLVNVANGRNATDAATVGQLRGALSTLGADIDAEGNVSTAGFTTQGQHHASLGQALSALDTTVTSTTTRVSNVETQLTSIFSSTPTTQANGTAQLTLAGAQGMVLSNVANGLVAAGSRDAVNGGQLHAVQQQLNGRMDGLEQRVDGQPQARASLAAARTATTDEATTEEAPQVASTADAPKPQPAAAPAPKADAPEDVKPQVDTADLERMLARANEYTDGISREVDARLDKMDKRFNRMAAMSSAQSAMAMNTAGLNTYNRLGAGVGYSDGESAMAVGYQRVLNEKGSATFSLNGAFTNSGERSMGVGVGIGW